MKRVTYKDLVAEILPEVHECFPWDVKIKLEKGDDLLFLDVRENQEYDTMRIKGSLHVPHGILESAVEWDHDETEPELVNARERQIVVCRSGSRSVCAAHIHTLPRHRRHRLHARFTEAVWMHTVNLRQRRLHSQAADSTTS
jgi:rhodanese-related sulfurtransferase